MTVDPGRVSGPEVHGLAVGDKVISTAPIPDVQMVNSQRATVIAVNEAWQMIDLRADDGQLLPGIQGDELDRLDLGVCDHRSPFAGRTVDTGHVLADRGGRELAYVAMSRPGEATDIYTTVDDQPWLSRTSRPTGSRSADPGGRSTPAYNPPPKPQRLEQDLDQRQRANVFAIAAHEKTTQGSERTRAAIAAGSTGTAPVLGRWSVAGVAGTGDGHSLLRPAERGREIGV